MSVQQYINAAALGEDFVVESAVKSGKCDVNAADPRVRPAPTMHLVIKYI